MCGIEHRGLFVRFRTKAPDAAGSLCAYKLPLAAYGIAYVVLGWCDSIGAALSAMRGSGCEHAHSR